MKKILFKKFSGAGNDFILIDQKENDDLKLTPEIVTAICNRRKGIGADGILEINDIEDYDFELTYYNSDGYPGSLCGNGSRCAIKYAKISGRINNSTKFICEGKEYKGNVLENGQVEFFLNSPENLRKSIKLNLDKTTVLGDFIDSGSPHYVVELEEIKSEHTIKFNDLSEVDVNVLGKNIRNDKCFSPEGTNVNFVSVKENNVKIRTFERGVEEETLACGTGCVASAFLLFLNKKVNPPVKLNVLGGDTLIVNFVHEKDMFSNISLTGPAELVFAGEYYLN